MLSSKKKTVGIIGKTSTGKTSFICSLAKNPERLKSLFALSTSRTKYSVDYVFKSKTEDDHISVSAVFNVLVLYRNLKDKKTEKDIADVKTIKRILKIDVEEEAKKIFREPSAENQDGWPLEKEISNMGPDSIYEQTRSIEIDEFSELIKIDAIGTYFDKFTVETPANDKLSEFIREKNLDSITFRDTRGLLDITADDDNKDNLKKGINASYKSLGLDGLDLVLLFGIDKAVENFSNLYKEQLTDVLNSVPVFFVSNIEDSVEILKMGTQSYETYLKKFLESSKALKCNPSLRFLAKYKAAEETGNPNKLEYRFTKFSYFDPYKVFYPMLGFEALSEITEMKNIDYFCTSTGDYPLYVECTTYIAVDALNKLFNYYDKVEETLRSRLLRGDVFEDSILNDLASEAASDFCKHYKYWEGYNKVNTEQYVHLYGYDEEKIVNLLMQKDHAILGPCDGITTESYTQYAATSIPGVFLRNMMYSWADELRFFAEDELKDKAEQEKDIYRSVLTNLLYRITDCNARIKGLAFINRYILKRAIEYAREHNSGRDIFLKEIFLHVLRECATILK